MTTTDLERLARAAITYEPSDHGKLSSVKMQIWQDALADLRDELFPERVLAMIAVIEAAKAMREEYSAVARTHMPIFDTFDAALAALDKEQE